MRSWTPSFAKTRPRSDFAFLAVIPSHRLRSAIDCPRANALSMINSSALKLTAVFGIEVVTVKGGVLAKVGRKIMDVESFRQVLGGGVSGQKQ